MLPHAVQKIKKKMLDTRCAMWPNSIAPTAVLYPLKRSGSFHAEGASKGRYRRDLKRNTVIDGAAE